MDSVRSSVEASFSRSRDVIMEERYRRLHYDPSVAPPFWAHTSSKAVPLSHFKHHLPAIPKKKSKDSKKLDHSEIPIYPKHYKDKYGSVSAHSTSAIYGALRAPHYHAVYGPSDVWYASVRSLNRSIHRDVVYTGDVYEWRETLYEEPPKEVFPAGTPIGTSVGASVATPVNAPVGAPHPRPPCMCMIRRRHPHEPPSSVSKSSRNPRCKMCSFYSSSNGFTNNSRLMLKRPSGIPEKIKTPIIAEKPEPKLETTSRMSGYKKCIPGSKYKNSSFNDKSTKDIRKISRKSILECDVTAYDLIKKVAKSPSESELDDSDIDDNLTDNAVSKINQLKRSNYEKKSKSAKPNNSPCKRFTKQSSSKSQSSNFKKSQSENCIYSESHSVLVGGQRIFTDNHKCTSPILSGNLIGDDKLKDVNRNVDESSWRKISASEESVCIPDPDYDFSDDSDNSTVINSNYMDPKFRYSPPPLRKTNELYQGLKYSSRELSKSMSSLQSDDTFVPSINTNKPNSPEWTSELQDCDRYENDKIDVSDKSDESGAEAQYQELPESPYNKLSSKQDSKYESSSDCSSSGGTLSSDYPTWTSSSSNELKSILKNKKKRENDQVIQYACANPDYFEDSKDSQRKKQVQFMSNTAIADAICTNGVDNEETFNQNIQNSDGKLATVIKDIYETVDEAKNEGKEFDDKTNLDFNSTKGAFLSSNDPFKVEDCINLPSKQNAAFSITGSSDTNFDLSLSPEDKQTSLSPALPLKLPPCLSNSLEDIRNGNQGGRSIIEKGKGRRRRRTTLPKRRFSDLHLHLLLCPTRSSFCGNGSSSDDMPLTTSPQRAHRSLPDSPSELDEVHSFCFDFLDKNTKDKDPNSSRSVFYVPVENHAQKTDLQACNSPSDGTPQTVLVSPSVEGNGKETLPATEVSKTPDVDANLSPEQSEIIKGILENEYEHLDPIYEELQDVINSAKRLGSTDSEPKSFFEGASKTDILSYLADAKERGLSTEGLSEDEKVIIEEDEEDEKILSDEDTGEKNRVITNNSINRKEVLLKIEEDIEKEENSEPENTGAAVSKSSRISEVERNDSGVGTETSKPARIKNLPEDWEEQLCADCDHQVEPIEDENSGLMFSPLVCRKCEFRRSERKEIIIEFVDTELKYGRDLKIIKDEFYKPMEIAGLLAKEQLQSIFLNLDELTAAHNKFSEKLQDALDIAMEHGDEDYTTVNIGKIFLESSSMLHAFETYCVKQASASIMLNHLEKEKELLRIFLRVSQVENTLLRRMNLPAFLMVPVQRVTRYPLLLSRLHKVTPIHHKDRNALKEAQMKVELHLEHINQQTKGVGGTKIWRRISNISASHRRLGKDIGSIKLRKMALEVLNWKQDEARFVIAGKLLFTQITDYPWNKKGKTVKFTHLHALLITLGKPNSNYRPESADTVLFPRNTGIRDASLVLMKEKSGRYITVREPLYLGNCVISCEGEEEDVFEIQEFTTKEAYLLKGETKKDSKEWLSQLRYHAKDLGSWRKRRNALANIMINGMIRQ